MNFSGLIPVANSCPQRQSVMPDCTSSGECGSRLRNSMGKKSFQGPMPSIAVRMLPVLLAILLCCPCLQTLLFSQARQESGDVAVVANAQVPMTNLSIFEVRHIFKGDKHYWKSNLPVVLLVPPAGSHERDVMLQVIYRMSELEYKQFWVGQIFRG